MQTTTSSSQKKSTKRYNLSLIAKRLDKIMARTRQHYETTPIGEEFETFVRDLYSCFPQTIRYDIFFASMIAHVGTRMTRETIRAIGWRLAGNLEMLKNNQPVPPWTVQRTAEWVPVLLLRATYARGQYKPGYNFEYRVLAGTPAGMKFTIFWSLDYLRYFARKLGFSRTKRRRFRFTNGLELVRMKVYLLLDPALSRDGQPYAKQFQVPATFKKENQTILAQRYHLDGPCMRGITVYNDLPCFTCYKGTEGSATATGCPVACRPKDLVIRPCPRCEEESAAFDPLSPGVVCVLCEQGAT